MIHCRNVKGIVAIAILSLRALLQYVVSIDGYVLCVGRVLCNLADLVWPEHPISSQTYPTRAEAYSLILAHKHHELM